jgi:hypothetical protein
LFTRKLLHSKYFLREKFENLVAYDYLEFGSFKIEKLRFVAFVLQKKYLLPTVIRVH